VKLDLFVQKTSNLFAERRMLRLIVLLIGGLQVLNGFMLYSVLDRERTVLVPVGTPARISITGSSADSSYLREMARYVAGLGLSYTPLNVRQQYEELLALFAPERFPVAQEQLYQAVDTAETAGASSVFFITDLIERPESHSLDILGTRQLFVQDKKVEDQKVSYRLSYRIRDGRFRIVEFSEQKESNP